MKTICPFSSRDRGFFVSAVLSLFVLACLILATPAAASETTATTAKHRVLSCNIRVALTTDTLNGVGWETRKDVCAEIIKRQDADIVCLQEVLREQIEDLASTMPAFEAFGFEGPEMDYPGKEYRGVAKNVILFSKERYELVGGATFWLSETPHLPASMSWGTARARHVNWVRLRDRRTGTQFRVLNTHLDHVAQEARLKQIGLILEEADQYAADFPQIFAGDFNARATNDVIKKIIDAGWTDTWRAIRGDEDAGFTVHQFQGAAYKPKKPAKYMKIDFIFTRGDITPTATHVIRDEIGGVYPSDHYFLSADLTF